MDIDKIISILLEVLILGVAVTILLTQNAELNMPGSQKVRHDFASGGFVETERATNQTLADWKATHAAAIAAFQE